MLSCMWKCVLYKINDYIEILAFAFKELRFLLLQIGSAGQQSESKLALTSFVEK